MPGMERPSFFRPADDMDLMDPLSDFEDETVISPPRGLAARSMALAAKKRGPGIPLQRIALVSLL